MLEHVKKTIAAILTGVFFSFTSMAQAMTYEEEHKLAQEVVTSLDAQGVIVYDQEITWPVKMITERLADHIKDPIYTFNIHVIMDRSINAFTIPDGHIYINVGTILFAKDMDEIAAVIGHEMGHAQLRHIPQAFEEQKEVTAASIVGVILGALVSAKNPEAGAALVFSSLGGGENIKLAYSRQHEHDADDFGRQILKASGYDPSSMNRFLSRLSAYSGATNIPEFLLTHPSTPTRISGPSPDSQKANPDSYFWTLTASVVGLTLPEDESLQRSKTLPDPYNRLALAILETRTGRNEKSLALLKDVNLPLANAYKGLNLASLGKKDEACPYLKQYGNFARAQMALAEILEQKGELKQAIDLLLPYQKQNIQVDYRLGVLQDKTSQPALSHASFARYFFKTSKYKAARYHIDKALELKKELDTSTVEELTEMKKYVQKAEQKH